jgi:protein-tyrosine phosphatase
MRQIEPHPLWIGHAGDGRDIPVIFDNGIRAVVQLAVEEPPIQPPHELIFCRFPLLDGIGNDPVLLRLAIHAVETLQRNRIRTLVCCGGGMSRAPAIAAAALSAVGWKQAEKCLKVVAEFCPADVSPGLWKDIRSALEDDE